MKIFSLIKAAFSQDMNLFKYTTKRNSSKINKIMFPVILFALICFSIGTYSFWLGEMLAPYNLTYVMLSMFIMAVTIISFMEGIYKSQGILFDAKDNDLLFSLPIKKSNILLVRILKLMVFQYLFNLMFLLPAIIAYIYYEKPGISFYFISILMSLLIPIIPTVISSVIGYIIKLVSSKFKSKKIMQTLLSSIVFLGIFFVSMNMEKFMAGLVENATSINEILTKIYYPIGLFINLINKFEVLDLIKLLVINLIPFAIFIVIGAKFYFKIISKSKENTTKKSNTKKGIIKQRKPIIAFTTKELKRYFSSPVYMFNTSFALILSICVSVLLCIKGKDIFEVMLTTYNIETNLSIQALFYFFVIFVGVSTSITSSSISLEGRTMNITKSLPIKEDVILKSKILTCFVIELPFIIISDLVFIIRFNPGLLYTLLIIIASFVTIFLSACIGLIANLKYPKMNASNDTEVVKQSMSSMVSVFAGMGIFFGSIALVFYLNKFINLEFLLIGHLSLLTIITIVLYVILMKKGPKQYREINV